MPKKPTLTDALNVDEISDFFQSFYKKKDIRF